MASPSSTGSLRVLGFISLIALLFFVSTTLAVPSNKTVHHKHISTRAICNTANSSWALTAANWIDAKVDENLRIFRDGGRDTENVTRPGVQPGQDFSNQLGIQLLNDDNWSCSLESPCSSDGVCENVVNGSRWGYFALIAFANLNSDWANLHEASQDAGIDLAAENLNIADTFGYDPPSHKTAIQKFLSIFGFFASMLGTAASLVAPEVDPIIMPGIELGSKIAGGLSSTFGVINSQIGLHTSQVVPWANAASFGQFVAYAFQGLQDALDETADQLFKGEAIGNTTILDVLAEGAWVQRSPVMRSDLTYAMKSHILSMGIDAMWHESKTTNTKVWVTFASMNDSDGSICAADRSGPQELKYCGDGGVYYVYRLEETGDHKGYLAKPWAIDNFTDFGLNTSWVAEASAKSYRSSPDGFDFNTSASATEFFQKIRNGEISDVIAEAGSMAGDWTVPVCDVGPHVEWNQDYITYPKQQHGPLPCYCGTRGSQTASFIAAAKMVDFETFPDWCKSQLKQPGAWPPGVTVIDLGWTQIHQ